MTGLFYHVVLSLGVLNRCPVLPSKAGGWIWERLDGYTPWCKPAPFQRAQFMLYNHTVGCWLTYCMFQARRDVLLPFSLPAQMHLHQFWKPLSRWENITVFTDIYYLTILSVCKTTSVQLSFYNIFCQFLDSLKYRTAPGYSLNMRTVKLLISFFSWLIWNFQTWIKKRNWLRQI